MKQRKSKETTSKKWERKEILMAALIGILVLTAGMQTVQLAGLASDQVVVPVSASPAPVKTNTGSAPSVPTSLQNLPSMVGGC